MIKGPEDRRPPMTPQLALRVTVVGTFALAMFGIIFFRLWFLQVLNTQAYTKQSQQNKVRPIYVPAERGEIVDRNGTVLVDSTPTVDVQLSLPDLKVPASPDNIEHPPRLDMIVYRRLAKVLGVSMKKSRCTFPNPLDPSHGVTVRLAYLPCQVATQQMKIPFQNVTVARDVSPDVQYYLAERQNLFPGVEALEVYRRHYPLNDLAAQLFGTVGPINKAETTLHRFKGVNPNAIVGQSGLEWTYDKYLRGVPGQDRVLVNALGQYEGELAPKRAKEGDTLKLSLDAQLQHVGEAALAQSVQSNPPADGGAFVAMNPVTGAIYAMGSYPTFNPTDFTHPMTNAYYDANYKNNPGDPLLNRAIDGAGPDGSTFKPITAIAALESGVWSVGNTYDDTGQYCFQNSNLCLHNAGGAANGSLDLVNAIKVSDDVFFYNLGALLNADPVKHPNGGALQHWAHQFGIGRTTGVDLPGEQTGTLPSPNFLEYLYGQELECEKAVGPYKGHPKQPGGCGISNQYSRYWTIGDNVNTAVGQGDDQVTPLQLAVVYSALANGGTIVRPHVGSQIDSPDGTVLQNFSSAPLRHLNINPFYLQAVRDGLRAAASQPGGTSATVFGNFPQQVYGKTGTAQYINNGVEVDSAWYACFVPPGATNTPIAVVVTVEKGGFGAVAAAPVAREILSQWFYGKPGPYTAGSSKTL